MPALSRFRDAAYTVRVEVGAVNERVLCVALVGLALACGCADKQAEGTGGGRVHNAPTTARNRGGFGGASFLASGGAGGTFFAGNGGAGFGGASGASALPPYSRDCITRRLARSSGDAGLIDATAGDVPPPRLHDGGRRDGAIDLGLGAGDLTMLVVFDKSGSMGQGWDERTKWQVANEAFMKAVDPVIDNLTIGTIFFPQLSGCDVAPLDSPDQMSFMPGRRFVEAWKGTEANRMPDGSTPLERAMRVADMAIERGCGLGLLDDRFRVVLVTDGEPTCSDDPNAIVGLAAEWSRVGVETWVMGLPGSEAATNLLDAIAHAGGTQSVQLPGTPTALDQGFAAVAR